MSDLPPDLEPTLPPEPAPLGSVRPRMPRTPGGVMYLVVLAVTAAALAMVVSDRWRSGLFMLGAGALLGALSRLVLRDEDAGMLGVRRKLVDVSTLTVLGLAVMALALAIPARF